jgi:prolyl-tRNA synthetase
MTRLSQYFLPTEKQPPADAEALSHKLLVRAGMIRQVGAGLWSWLPAGWRVHEKAVQIVREELNAIGAQEMLMPVLNPAELWQKSGRYDAIGGELFRLKDRRGADMVLAMTHEEVVTSHVAQVVRSYRDLPLILYHFQTKERDEPRPRAGVLRTREFIMKDSYTFDRDAAGLDVGYEKHRVAYDKIFDRCGLEWYRVDSDVGMMGGTGAHEYMAPCPAGENDVALAPGYAANVEVASATPKPVELPPALAAPEEFSTPGATTIEAVSQLAGVPAGALIKAYPIIVGEDELRLVLVRGDHRVNDIKLGNALGAPFRPAHESEFEDRIGPAGYIGPVGIDVPILVDAALDGDSYIAGANKADAHLRGVQPGRDFTGETVDVRTVEAGDTVDGHEIRIEPAIEIGNIFKLGTRYSDLPRRGRQLAADLDGLLRHRPGAHLRRRGRAVRRREGHLVAALAGAVRRAPGGPGQAGHRGARAGRAPVRGAHRRRARRDLRRPRPRAGREVRRRGAARLPAAADRRQAHDRGRGDRGAGPARARDPVRSARGRGAGRL